MSRSFLITMNDQPLRTKNILHSSKMIKTIETMLKIHCCKTSMQWYLVRTISYELRYFLPIITFWKNMGGNGCVFMWPFFVIEKFWWHHLNQFIWIGFLAFVLVLPTDWISVLDVFQSKHKILYFDFWALKCHFHCEAFISFGQL